ncbi:putative D-alanyl-D-alanine carboxypeptidase [Actinoplanes missouriensis 431]|uniref:Putative D-alanyl-D-alanine carboxypeptidase n=1 Tax=Actinoplanes missouriensis (strain ATCC 14538 / DSM 43046 / CBS 188.64 / JCM 3121 / NBRC 102363 / NCIMB 12654 / NRRL B-3342 / UNCC 431) TaxID=512565 RepID=I0H999_ACTM4|nr:M15 family metallopeptidase [Actinoplanes missouriensis]BAL89586.1 putative D-alanyl-D-alanine carboxypeptidase [Actinoplanes missouriensis 431]
MRRRLVLGPVLATLAVLGTAAPAEAAATPKAVQAGATWSTVMTRKLNLETAHARLTTQLPAMRTTVTTRNATVVAARKADAAATAALTRATSADQVARAKHAAAKTVTVAARKAVSAAKKQRPYSGNRVAKAQKAWTAADATARSRAAAIRRSATALSAARTASAATKRQVTAAVTAHRTAVTAVANAEASVAAWPKTRSALAAQATALSAQVVTQTRATFTTAQTTRVYGVTVNKIMAVPFQRMIDDAAKAGIKLSGGGFRTKEQQIALRKSNGCPDVWTAPSPSCRVPTAIPGRSLHELGLAIDMTSGGKGINSRKNPAFVWMAANAGRYGLVNLPSEPWHWSITGS